MIGSTSGTQPALTQEPNQNQTNRRLNQTNITITIMNQIDQLFSKLIDPTPLTHPNSSSSVLSSPTLPSVHRSVPHTRPHSHQPSISSQTPSISLLDLLQSNFNPKPQADPLPNIPPIKPDPHIQTQSLLMR